MLVLMIVMVWNEGDDGVLVIIKYADRADPTRSRQLRKRGISSITQRRSRSRGEERPVLRV